MATKFGSSLVSQHSISSEMNGKLVCACGSKLTRLSDRMLLVWADHEGSAVDVCLHRCWGLGMFLYGTLYVLSAVDVCLHRCRGLGMFL